MKSVAQIFEHNEKYVIIDKSITIPPGANIHYRLVKDDVISDDMFIFYAKSVEEFSKEFVHTGRSINIDINEDLFWDLAQQDASKLRSNQEAWAIEQQERRAWASLDTIEEKHMEDKVWETKSSGKQQEFGTGAKRDIQQGKGRFDLIPPHTLMLVAKKYASYGKISKPTDKTIGCAIEILYESLNKNNIDILDDIAEAIWYVLEYMEHDGRFYEKLPEHNYTDIGEEVYRFDLIPYSSIKRVVDVYERGADLYGPRNWEQGMPLSRLLDSALRHLFQCIAGKDDEDHAAQGAWNVIGFAETLWRIQQGYLPQDLDNRLELKKIEKDLLDFDGEEVVEKGLSLPQLLNSSYDRNNPFYDHYGFSTEPKGFGCAGCGSVLSDGYGKQHEFDPQIIGTSVPAPRLEFDEGDVDLSDEAFDDTNNNTSYNYKEACRLLHLLDYLEKHGRSQSYEAVPIRETLQDIELTDEEQENWDALSASLRKQL